MIIDNKQNLKMKSNKNTFKSLAEELYHDNRVSELENVCNLATNVHLCR